jgi:HEAT repeat protein
VTDAFAPVTAAAQNDSDARVRASACHTLGVIGNSSVVSVLTNLKNSDPDVFVRDQAAIALLKL